MGLITCPESPTTPDAESANFTSGPDATALSSSRIMVFEREVTVTGWGISATTVPTGNETVLIKHINPVAPSITTIATATLLTGAQISTGVVVGGYVIPAGHGIQTEITAANGSVQLNVTVHFVG